MYYKNLIGCLCVLSELFYEMPIWPNSNIRFWLSFVVLTENDKIIHMFCTLQFFFTNVFLVKIISDNETQAKETIARNSLMKDETI